MTRTMRRRYLMAPAAATAAIGLAGLLSACGGQSTTAGGTPAATSSTPTRLAVSRSSAPPTRHLTITIKSDEQRAKKGPDGAFHDAFLPAGFTVRPGQRVVVRFRNFDDSPHSFTSPGRGAGAAMPVRARGAQRGRTATPGGGLGVDAIIPGGTDGAPGTATVAFTAPAKAGKYAWFCKLPCDPWAMAHDGFMRGYVTVA